MNLMYIMSVHDEAVDDELRC